MKSSYAYEGEGQVSGNSRKASEYLPDDSEGNDLEWLEREGYGDAPKESCDRGYDSPTNPAERKALAAKQRAQPQKPEPEIDTDLTRRGSSDGRFEKYDYASEYQDQILACIVKHPEKFTCYAGVLNSAYFSGTARIVAARTILKHWKDNGRFPNWATLGQEVFESIKRTSESKDEESIARYITKLGSMDTSDADAVSREVIKFAKRRAYWIAFEEGIKCYSEGTEPVGGFSNLFLEAEKVGLNGHGVVTIEDVIADDGKAPEALIEGQLRVGGLETISGRAKSAKSFVAMDKGLAVADGALWLDKFETHPRKVVYVNFELSQKTVKMRLKSIAKARGIELDRLKGKFFAVTPDLKEANRAIRGVKQGPHENRFAEAVLAIVEREVRRLVGTGAYVILDSYYNLCGGINENDAAATKLVYAVIRRTLDRLEGTGMLVHHFSKGSPGEKMEGERAAGSRVHRQEPDCYIELVPHDDEDFALILTADQRDYAPIAKFCLRWKFPVMELAPDLDPEKVKKPPNKGRKAEYSLKNVLEPLKERPMGDREWQFEVLNETGMSARTFERLKAAARNQGKVQKEGEKWALTSPSK